MPTLNDFMDGPVKSIDLQVLYKILAALSVFYISDSWPSRI